MEDHHHNINDPEHSNVYKDKYPNRGVDLNGSWGPPAHDREDDRWDHPHSGTSDKKQNRDHCWPGGSRLQERKGDKANMKVGYIMRV